MQELKTKINDLSEDIEAYIEAYYELKVLKISEKASLMATQSIIASVQLTLLIFVMIFASMGLAWWIGVALNNVIAGFFIVAGIYTLLLIILIGFKKAFVPMLRNAIIKKMFEEL
ncbi:MAG TPA: phage holin family protein [Ohtaekwangia sp.]